MPYARKMVTRNHKFVRRGFLFYLSGFLVGTDALRLSVIDLRRMENDE